MDKTVQFLGTGAADGDTAIFVPQGATDCSGTAEGSLAGTDASSGQLTIVEAGTSFQFSAAPSITSGKLALCYAFGAEPLALFPDVVVRTQYMTHRCMLSDCSSPRHTLLTACLRVLSLVTQVNVGFISKMRVTGGNGGNYAIVVGQPKSFTFQGTGIRSGDKVKVVPGSATSDEHCTSLPARCVAVPLRPPHTASAACCCQAVALSRGARLTSHVDDLQRHADGRRGSGCHSRQRWQCRDQNAGDQPQGVAVQAVLQVRVPPVAAVHDALAHITGECVPGCSYHVAPHQHCRHSPLPLPPARAPSLLRVWCACRASSL